MRFKTVFLTVLFLLMVNSLQHKEVFAGIIYPYKNEILISNEERTKGSVYFENDSKKDVLITPIVHSYDPETLEMTNSNGIIFTRADKEIFKAKPKEILEIEYEVVPITNMKPGTYFNLIVLERQMEDTFVTETSPVGTVESLSQLVVLHIVDSESDIYGISSKFATIDIQVIEKGVPFMSPTTIKYSYKNDTNYVLNPMGEIQLYSKRGDYPPIYLKINEKQQRLYPQGLLEEEFEIDDYHISDFFSEKIVVGRFYNGIDENIIVEEVIIQPNYTVLLLIGLGLVLTVIFLKVLFSKKKPKKNPV